MQDQDLEEELIRIPDAPSHNLPISGGKGILKFDNQPILIDLLVKYYLKLNHQQVELEMMMKMSLVRWQHGQTHKICLA